MLTNVEDAILLRDAYNARAVELGLEGELCGLKWAAIALGRISIQSPHTYLKGLDESVALGLAEALLPAGTRFGGTIDDAHWPEILEGAAKLIFAQEWHNAETEAGRSYPGQNIYDVMPTDIPDEAFVEAGVIIGRIEAKNSIKIDAAWLRARNAELGDGASIAAFENGEHMLFDNARFTAERFGECMVYEAIGAGPGWTDDFKPHGLDIPSYEIVFESPLADPAPGLSS